MPMPPWSCTTFYATLRPARPTATLAIDSSLSASGRFSAIAMQAAITMERDYSSATSMSTWPIYRVPTLGRQDVCQRT